MDLEKFQKNIYNLINECIDKEVKFVFGDFKIVAEVGQYGENPLLLSDDIVFIDFKDKNFYLPKPFKHITNDSLNSRYGFYNLLKELYKNNFVLRSIRIEPEFNSFILLKSFPNEEYFELKNSEQIENAVKYSFKNIENSYFKKCFEDDIGFIAYKGNELGNVLFDYESYYYESVYKIDLYENDKLLETKLFYTGDDAFDYLDSLKMIKVNINYER